MITIDIPSSSFVNVFMSDLMVAVDLKFSKRVIKVGDITPLEKYNAYILRGVIGDAELYQYGNNAIIARENNEWTIPLLDSDEKVFSYKFAKTKDASFYYFAGVHSVVDSTMLFPILIEEICVRCEPEFEYQRRFINFREHGTLYAFGTVNIGKNYILSKGSNSNYFISLDADPVIYILRYPIFDEISRISGGFLVRNENSIMMTDDLFNVKWMGKYDHIKLAPYSSFFGIPVFLSGDTLFKIVDNEAKESFKKVIAYTCSEKAMAIITSENVMYVLTDKSELI